jgi:hypothetical protein
MGIFSDSITVSGSHAASRTAESAIVSASSDPVNRATILSAVKQIQATGGTVNLNLSRFAQDTLHPSGRETGEQTMTIRPDDSAEATADQIMAALNGIGADRAEKSLVTATLSASAAAMAGTDRTGHTSGMFIRIARAGGLAEYAR